MSSLAKRVEALEQKESLIGRRPDEFFTEPEFAVLVRGALEAIFREGKHKEIQDKLLRYESQGKSLIDLDKEDSRFYINLLNIVLDEEPVWSAYCETCNPSPGYKVKKSRGI